MSEIEDADANYRAFIKGADEERAKYWVPREAQQKQDTRREDKGLYFLGLSIFSLLGGMVSILYGLAGKDWVQKPYLILGALMVIVGLSIVIGGFGKVKN